VRPGPSVNLTDSNSSRYASDLFVCRWLRAPQPPKSHGGPCHSTGVPVPPSPGTWPPRGASSRLCGRVGSKGGRGGPRSRKRLERAAHRPRGSRGDGFARCPLVTLRGDTVTCRDPAAIPLSSGDMPYIVCAIPFPYSLPGRSTLPWPRASLDIIALDRSLEIAQPVASEAEPAGPRPGAVLRSAPFRNTADLRVHVMPT